MRTLCLKGSKKYSCMHDVANWQYWWEISAFLYWKTTQQGLMQWYFSTTCPCFSAWSRHVTYLPALRSSLTSSLGLLPASGQISSNRVGFAKLFHCMLLRSATVRSMKLRFYAGQQGPKPRFWVWKPGRNWELGRWQLAKKWPNFYMVGKHQPCSYTLCTQFQNLVATGQMVRKKHLVPPLHLIFQIGCQLFTCLYRSSPPRCCRQKMHGIDWFADNLHMLLVL